MNLSKYFFVYNYLYNYLRNNSKQAPAVGDVPKIFLHPYDVTRRIWKKEIHRNRNIRMSFFYYVKFYSKFRQGMPT